MSSEGNRFQTASSITVTTEFSVFLFTVIQISPTRIWFDGFSSMWMTFFYEDQEELLRGRMQKYVCDCYHKIVRGNISTLSTVISCAVPLPPFFPERTSYLVLPADPFRSQAMHQTQSLWRLYVRNFRFNLGFCGQFFERAKWADRPGYEAVLSKSYLILQPFEKSVTLPFSLCSQLCYSLRPNFRIDIRQLR